MSFFKCGDLSRLDKLSHQRSNQIVSSSELLLDRARQLTPIQYPSLPFLSSTNNRSTYSCSTLTTNTSNKRYVKLKDSIPSCPCVYLFTPLSNSYIHRYEQPQSVTCPTNSHPCLSHLIINKNNLIN